MDNGSDKKFGQEQQSCSTAADSPPQQTKNNNIPNLAPTGSTESSLSSNEIHAAASSSYPGATTTTSSSADTATKNGSSYHPNNDGTHEQPDSKMPAAARTKSGGGVVLEDLASEDHTFLTARIWKLWQQDDNKPTEGQQRQSSRMIPKDFPEWMKTCPVFLVMEDEEDVSGLARLDSLTAFVRQLGQSILATKNDVLLLNPGRVDRGAQENIIPAVFGVEIGTLVLDDQGDAVRVFARNSKAAVPAVTALLHLAAKGQVGRLQVHPEDCTNPDMSVEIPFPAFPLKLAHSFHLILKNCRVSKDEQAENLALFKSLEFEGCKMESAAAAVAFENAVFGNDNFGGISFPTKFGWPASSLLRLLNLPLKMVFGALSLTCFPEDAMREFLPAFARRLVQQMEETHKGLARLEIDARAFWDHRIMLLGQLGIALKSRPHHIEKLAAGQLPSSHGIIGKEKQVQKLWKALHSWSKDQSTAVSSHQALTVSMPLSLPPLTPAASKRKKAPEGETRKAKNHRMIGPDGAKTPAVSDPTVADSKIPAVAHKNSLPAGLKQPPSGSLPSTPAGAGSVGSVGTAAAVGTAVAADAGMGREEQTGVQKSTTKAALAALMNPSVAPATTETNLQPKSLGVGTQ